MRRFLNGILMGSFLIALVGIVANGNMKPQSKRLLDKTKKYSKQVTSVMGNASTHVTKGVSSLMKKR